jgi:hypothetical protein
MFKWANSIVKKFDFLDVKLLATVGFFIGFIVVKLFPSILTVNIWVWVIVAVILYIRPFLKVFKK